MGGILASLMATGGRDAHLLWGFLVEDGGVDLKGPLGPHSLGPILTVFPFGVQVVVLAGISDVLSANEDVAGIYREKDRG